MPDRSDASPAVRVLRGLAEEIRDVGEHLLRYEEGVVARFALAGGPVAATDLQRLDLSIQILDDLHSVADSLAMALEAGREVAPSLLLAGARLERTRRRFDDLSVSSTSPTPIELF